MLQKMKGKEHFNQYFHVFLINFKTLQRYELKAQEV